MGAQQSAPVVSEPLLATVVREDLSSLLLSDAVESFYDGSIPAKGDYAQLIEHRKFLEKKASDFDALLEAGVREDGSKQPDKSATFVRLLESLASTLAPMDKQSDNLKYVTPTVAITDLYAKLERQQADVPLFRVPLAPARVDARSNMLKHLVLETLSSFVDAVAQNPDVLDGKAAESAVEEIVRIVAPLGTGSLFSDISPAQMPPEKIVTSDIADYRRVYATACATGSNAGAALKLGHELAAAPASQNSAPIFANGWRADTGTRQVWGISFAHPVPISSVKMFWMNGAPQAYAVEVTSDKLPDPLAHALRIPTAIHALHNNTDNTFNTCPDILSLDTPEATAASGAAAAIICNSGADEAGVGALSDVKISLTPDSDSANATPCGVTWRRVVPVTPVTAEENGGKKVGDAGRGVAPHSYATVGMHADGSCDLITGIRIFLLKGKLAANERNAVGLAAVQLMQPDTDICFVPSATTVKSVQSWLHAAASRSLVHSSSALSSPALAASTKLVQASGSLEALLRYLHTVLESSPGGALESHSMGAATATSITPLLAAMKQEVKIAADRVVVAKSSRKTAGGSGEVEVRFDPGASGSSSGSLSSAVTFSNDNKTVRSVSGSNCLIIGDVGFSSGVVSWEFNMDEDNDHDECTCIGVVCKPIERYSYEAPNVYMYRCYNGELYGENNAGMQQEIRAKSRVKIVYDAPAGTLTYFANDKEIGVCFRNMGGKELFPAVSFYNSNRQASLIKCEILVPGTGTSAVAAGSPGSSLDVTALLAKPMECPTFKAMHDAKPDNALALTGTLLAHACDIAAVWSPSIYDNGARPISAACTQQQVLRLEEPFAIQASVDSFSMLTELLRRFSMHTRNPHVAGGADSAVAELPKATATAESKVPSASASTTGPARKSPAAASKGPTATVPAKTPAGKAPTTKATAPGVQESYLQLSVMVLRLLRANFERIVSAHVDPRDARLVVDGDSPSLHPLHALLQTIMSFDGGYPERLQLECVHTVEAGLAILYASPQTRAELLNDLIDKYVQSSRNSIPLSAAHTELLARCLRYFSSVKGVLSLLPQKHSVSNGGKVARTDDSLQLFKALLNILTGETTRNLHSTAKEHSSGIGDETNNNLLSGGIALLVAYQKHLFSLVAEESAAAAQRAKAGKKFNGDQIVDFPSKSSLELVQDHTEFLDARLAGASWVASLSSKRTAAAQVLLGFLDELVGSAKCILEPAVHLAEQQAAAALSPAGLSKLPMELHADVDNIVRGSIVGSLLPGCLSGLASLSEPWLVAHTSQSMLPLWKLLQRYNAHITQLKQNIRHQIAELYRSSIESVPSQTFVTLQLLGCTDIQHAMSIPPIEGDCPWTQDGAAPASGYSSYSGHALVGGRFCPLQAWLKIQDSEAASSDEKAGETKSIKGCGHILLPFGRATANIAGSKCGAALKGIVDAVGASLMPPLVCPITVAGNAAVGTALKLDVTIEFPSDGEGHHEEHAAQTTDQHSKKAKSSTSSTKSTVSAKAKGSAHEAPTKAAGSRSRTGSATAETADWSSDEVFKGFTKVKINVAGALDKLDPERQIVGIMSASESVLSDAAAPLAVEAALGVKAARKLEFQRKAGAGILPVDTDHWAEVRRNAWGGYLLLKAASLTADTALANAKESRSQNVSRNGAKHTGSDWHARMLQLVASYIGKIVETLLSGPHVSYEEEELRSVLRSHIMAGGASINGLLDAASETTGIPFTEMFLYESIDTGAGANQLRDIIGADGTAGRLFTQFFEWLQKATPENALKRRAGLFPEVEVPVFLAICKQVDLLDKVYSVCSQLDKGDSAPPMEEELAQIWKGVQVIRAFLRVQKAEMKNKKDEPPKEEVPAKDKARTLVPVTPKTFEELLSATKERALFVLKLDRAAAADSLRTTSAAGDVAEADTLRQLQQKWSTMLPSVGLQLSRLTSQNSMQSSDDSMPKPSAKPTLGRMVSLQAAEEEAVGDTGSDVATFAVEAADESGFAGPQESIAKSIRDYVKLGFGAPPTLLSRLLFWRTVRALARIQGYKIAMEILAEKVVDAASTHSILSVLRGALRGVVERQLDASAAGEKPAADKKADHDEDTDDDANGTEGAESKAADAIDSLSIRHHYSSNLEGCTGKLMTQLQLAHHDLYASLAGMLADAMAARDIATASLLLWSWGCDAPARDHDFITQCGIVEALSSFAAPSAAAANIDAPPSWRPWRVDFVRYRLHDGSLSKHQVFAHIKSAPADLVGRLTAHTESKAEETGADWLSRNCSGDLSAYTVSQTAAVYERFITQCSKESPESEFAGLWDATTDTNLESSLLDARASALLGMEYSAEAETKPSETDFDSLDAMNRAKREKRARTTLKMPSHGHELTFSTEKNTYWCDKCGNRGDSNKIGVGMWYCARASCSAYICEKCFAERPGKDEWEEMPISDVSTTFEDASWSPSDNYSLLPFPPQTNRRLWSNDTSEFFTTLPDFMSKGHGRHYFYSVALHKSGGKTAVSTECFTAEVCTGRRVRVWLGILASCVNKLTPSKCAWLHEEYTKTKYKVTSSADRYTLFRRKKVALHAGDAGTWADQVESDAKKIQVHGLGLEAAKNYIMILEEIPVDDLTYVDIYGKAEEKAATDESVAVHAVLKPVAPPFSSTMLLQHQAWALVRLLMLTSVGGTAVHSVPATGASSDVLPRAPALLPSTSAIMRSTGSPTHDAASHASDKLQRLVFRILRQFLMTSVDALRAAAKNEKGCDIDGVTAEMFADTALQFVFAISDVHNAKAFLSERTFVGLFLQLLRYGSPRARAASARVLRSLCSRIEPESFEDAFLDVFPFEEVELWSAIAGRGGAPASLGFLLEAVAAPVLMGHGLAVDSNLVSDIPLHSDSAFANAFGSRHVMKGAQFAKVGAGTAIQMLAADSVAFLRSLLRFKEWRDKYVPFLVQHLQAATEAMGALSSESSFVPPHFVGCVGTIAMLGGHADILRPGARVLVANVRYGSSAAADAASKDQPANSGAEMEATIVRYAPGSVQVTYSKDISAVPIAVDGRRLLPLPDITVPANLLDSFADRFSVCRSILQSSIGKPGLMGHIGFLCLGALQQMLNSAGGASTALRSGLLEDLYAWALKPSPLKNFTATPALLAVMRNLQRTAIDLPRLAAVPSVIVEVSSEDDAADFTTTLDDQGAVVALEAQVDVAFAKSALRMHNGDPTSAIKWLTVHKSSYFYEVPNAAQIPRGQFVGVCEVKAEGGAGETIAVLLLDVQAPTAGELDAIGEDGFSDAFNDMPFTAELAVLSPAAAKLAAVVPHHGWVAYLQSLRAADEEEEDRELKKLAFALNFEGTMTSAAGGFELTFTASEDLCIPLVVGPNVATVEISVPTEALSCPVATESLSFTLTPQLGQPEAEKSEGSTLSDSVVVEFDEKDDAASEDDSDDDSSAPKRSGALLLDSDLTQPSATGRAAASGEADFPISKTANAPTLQAGPPTIQRAGRTPDAPIDFDTAQAATLPTGALVLVTSSQSLVDGINADLSQLTLAIVTSNASEHPVVSFCDVLRGRTGTVRVKRNQLRQVFSTHGVKWGTPESVPSSDDLAASVAEKFQQTIVALTLHSARHTIQRLLTLLAREDADKAQDALCAAESKDDADHDTVFSLDRVGGAKRLLSLIRVVAANDCSLPIGKDPRDIIQEIASNPSTENEDVATAAVDDSSRVSGHSYGMATLGGLRYVFKQLLLKEKLLAVSPSPAKPSDPLSAALVNDCINNFVRSLKADPLRCAVAESIHPLPAEGVYSGKLSLPGSASLELTFDARCQSSKHEILYLYSSSKMDDASLIGKFGGPTADVGICSSKKFTRWPSQALKISGSHVWWKLSCGRGKPIDELLTLKQSLPAGYGAAVASASDSKSVSEAEYKDEGSGTGMEPPASAALGAEDADIAEAIRLSLERTATNAVPRTLRIVRRSADDDDDEDDDAGSKSGSEASMGLGNLFGDDDDNEEDEASDEEHADPAAKTQNLVQHLGMATDSWGFRFSVKQVAGQWTSESNALSPASCSLAWACWLLDFLLNQVSTVLQRGAVHNQHMFDALVTFLRTKLTEPAMREQVVTLLSQLLIHPHMFLSDPNLEALEGVERAVMEKAKSLLSSRSGGAAFLPAKLQDLLELVIARRAAQNAFKAAAAAKSAKAGGELSSEPYPGAGVGVLLDHKSGIVPGESPLELSDVIDQFKATYSAAATSVLTADMIMQGMEGMTGEASPRNGVVFRSQVVKMDEADKLEAFELTWLLLNAHAHGLVPATATVPEDAFLDCYDLCYLFMTMMIADGGVTSDDGESPTEEEMEAAKRMEAIQQHITMLKMGMETEGPEWPLPFTPCKVNKPWADTAAAGPLAQGALVTLRVVRPIALSDSFPIHAMAAGALPSVPEEKKEHSWQLTLLDKSTDLSSSDGTFQVYLLREETDEAIRAIITDKGDGLSNAALIIATSGLDAHSEVSTADDVAAEAISKILHESIEWAFSLGIPAGCSVFAVSQVNAEKLAAIAQEAGKPKGSATAVVAAESESTGAGAAPLSSPKVTGTFSLAGIAAKMTRVRDMARVRMLQRGLSEKNVGTATTGQFAALMGRDLEKGGVASFAGVPLKPILPKNDVPKELIDKLMLVQELSAALFESARPSDEVICAAWLEAVGLHRHAETNHPLRLGECLNGTVEIKGATKLSVAFNPRCALPSGSAITLTFIEGGKAISKSFGGPALTSSSSSTKGGWPKEALSINASKVSYSFSGPDALCEQYYGISFTVSGTVPAGARHALLAKHTNEVVFAAKQLLTQWNHVLDADLVNLARKVGSGFVDPTADDEDDEDSDSDSGSEKKKSKKHSLETLPLELLDIRNDADALQYGNLQTVPIPQMRMRFALIRLFNKVLKDTLSCFALSSTKTWSIGYRLRHLSHCVFSEVKEKVLNAAIKATRGEGSIPTLYLSNFKASESESRGDVTPETSLCMFVQAYLHLRAQPSQALRSYEDEDQHKVFEVQFEGESGIDAGGVYREGLSRIIDDLFSDRFNLLIPCENNKRGDKLNSDSFVPNPAHHTPLALSMLEFLGRMLGLSLRTKAALSFSFPSIVWKYMVGEKAKSDDLMMMDTNFAEYLDGIRNCDKEMLVDGKSRAPILSEADFAAAYAGLMFSIAGSDGNVVELMPGGTTIPVTLANRLRFCDAAEKFRLQEFDVQLAAIKRGLGNLVPLNALSLFTWQECEILAAGDPDVDLELLKRKTEYSGYDKEDAVITRFWKCLASMTGAERSSYLRFVWGRARLPGEGTRWSHTISSMSGGDSVLPLAHTCFCTIDLPAYTTDEKMSWGLRTAVHYGLGGILNG